MSNLPANWAICNLGDVLEMRTGPFGSALHKHDYVSNGIPVINPTHIKNTCIDPDYSVSISKDKATELSEYKLYPNDVIMGRRGEMGRCAVVPDHADGWICGTGSVILKTSAALNSNYLQRYLSSPNTVRSLEGESVGSTMVNLNQKILLGLSIGIPPLQEQRRIADKLDTTLARVDALNDRLARITPLLQRFRQSVLAAATSGRLTEDWRTNQQLAEWDKKELKDVCISISDGDHQAPPQSTEGIPFITISAINDGRLNLYKATRAVPLSYYESLDSKRRAEIGDILYSVTGSIGIPALITKFEKFTFQRHIAILRPNHDYVSSKFLYFLLASDLIRQQALGVATGTAQLTIPLKGLRGFKFELPALAEQTEIVRRVETLFAFADRLQARLQSAQTAAERLTPALLAKAFRGELVPQDPNDEPATELLRRLREARAAEAPAKSKRGRKTTA